MSESFCKLRKLCENDNANIFVETLGMHLANNDKSSESAQKVSQGIKGKWYHSEYPSMKSYKPDVCYRF